MRVLLSVAQRRVAQPFPDGHDVGAVLEHVSRKAVSQPMRSHLHFNAGELELQGDHPLKTSRCNPHAVTA
jgi:hypothetical protein